MNKERKTEVGRLVYEENYSFVFPFNPGSGQNQNSEKNSKGMKNIWYCVKA